LLEHGFLDYIIERTELRQTLGLSLKLFFNWSQKFVF
jgi:acetyl-CoA carboxylase beta subunit